MTDQRLLVLEEKLAHQEHTLAEMSQELYLQQGRIDALERLGRSLAERLQGINQRLEEPGQDGPQPPPHY